jgi:hypothetical protein
MINDNAIVIQYSTKNISLNVICIKKTKQFKHICISKQTKKNKIIILAKTLHYLFKLKRRILY